MGPLYRKLIHRIAWPFNDYLYFQFVISSRLGFQHSTSPGKKHFHTLKFAHGFSSKIDCELNGTG